MLSNYTIFFYTGLGFWIKILYSLAVAICGGMMIYSTSYTGPFGEIHLASDGTFLTELTTPTEYRRLHPGQHGKEKAPIMPDDSGNLPCFNETKKWLDIYFSGRCPDFTPPLLPAGTPFQQLIWSLLRDIPYGTLTTYGTLAKKAAALMHKTAMSAQAVGGAVGANPISIIVPCHRVIGQNGSLTGYAGGLKLKVLLLQTEGIDTSALSMPKNSRFL